MKKVLFISPQPFFQWRGSPIRVGFNVQALAELGLEVDLLTLPVGADRDIPGVRIIRVPNVFMVKSFPIGPSLVKAAFDVLIFFKGLSLARRNRYDVIHGIEDAGLLAVIIARLSGAKSVFEKHSDPSSYKKGCLRNLVMRGYATVERYTVRHADAVIGTGAGLAEQMKNMGQNVQAHHIQDIPSSLQEASPDKTAEVREKLAGNQQRVLFSFVGSFAVYQGIDLMFDAIARVAAELPEALFVVIGGTSEEIAARKQWLLSNKIQSRELCETDSASNKECRVVFVGKVSPDDLPDYLAASDVFMSPRLTGVNTPLKLLDYMKAGKAILATDNVSNRLLLNDEIALLTSVDANGFAEGISRLVKDSDLREKLGGQGKKIIAEKYNFNEFKKKLALCYEGLI
ncbi:MAG: glycosyltransferase family 4 protein [Kiritimatiellae bacterium]|nr:glycosyltransferase family 4 protein [Kiritimatiellia bacterium]